ncbi:putative transposase IS605 family protein [Microseira wollei NIES-4236]|uniref:Transposase IS605 family protein n=1 Tax=Microseira wollei NIES-4236 TaxID=2530354 RepID=A0AAV3X6G7_9CYAN|nr:putative transposase IS605 family protein [Microseira wollei NIES-4236]
MKTTYQYRFYPDNKQKLELNYWLRVSRYWYNYQLGDRFDWWGMNRTAVNYCPLVSSIASREKPNFYSQKAQLPSLKKELVKVHHSGELLDFSRVDSTILQEVSKRVEKAFQRFIVGDSNGNRSGKPRFKTEADFRTMTFATAKNDWLKLIRKNWFYLRLPKLGVVKVRMHRALPEGFNLKQVSVTKKADGWYINLILREDDSVPEFTPDEIVPTWDNSTGLDAVLHEDVYLATSEGEKIPSLKPLGKNQAKLDRISTKRNKRKRGSKARRKLAKREARQHQRIARSRQDFQYKTAHKLVRTGKKVFFHEDLNLKGLTKRNQAKQEEKGHYLPNGQAAKSGLNKSWNDAAFGQFFATLDYIAAKAGAVVIAKNPAYTSMVLSYRNELIFTDCSIRGYWDEAENLMVDRDVNAAINLKRVGP